jgi:hypothetical protein
MIIKLKRAFGLIVASLLLIPSIAIVSDAENSIKTKIYVWNRFTIEERKKLKAGETVYRYAEIKDEDGKTRGRAWSSVIVKTPIDQCFKIFLEFDKHHLFIPRKTKSEVIKTWENKTLVHNEFDFYLLKVEYTSLFTVDEKEHRVDYDMAPEYKHDINDTEGYFHFEKIDDTRTLFTYAVTKVDTGLTVPSFVMEYLTSRDLPNVVLNVRKRIESRGKWTKED